MKKGGKGKEEEIDISTLPPIVAINCVLKFDSKKERAKNLMNFLL